MSGERQCVINTQEMHNLSHLSSKFASGDKVGTSLGTLL